MGLLRLVLALSVIAAHANTPVFGYRGIGGWYAVDFFFVISGFYMAMVLNEKYRDAPAERFYLSRLLRLLPVYYIGLLLSLLTFWPAISGVWRSLEPGALVYFVLQNVFVFGQDLSYPLCVPKQGGGCIGLPLAMNPPSWSLAVELGFYFVAPYLLRSKARTFAFVLYGALYLASLKLLRFPLAATGVFGAAEPPIYTFYFYPASFVFFGGGALAYHLRRGATGADYAGGALLLLLLSSADTVMPFWHLLLASLAVPVLFELTARNRLDRWLGEMSYPVYILHFPILQALLPWFGKQPDPPGALSLGSWVAIASCAAGAVLYRVVEVPVNRRREALSAASVGLPAWSLPAWLGRSALLLYLAVPAASVAYLLRATA